VDRQELITRILRSRRPYYEIKKIVSNEDTAEDPVVIDLVTTLAHFVVEELEREWMMSEAISDSFDTMLMMPTLVSSWEFRKTLQSKPDICQACISHLKHVLKSEHLWNRKGKKWKLLEQIARTPELIQHEDLIMQLSEESSFMSAAILEAPDPSSLILLLSPILRRHPVGSDVVDAINERSIDIVRGLHSSSGRRLAEILIGFENLARDLLEVAHEQIHPPQIQDEFGPMPDEEGELLDWVEGICSQMDWPRAREHLCQSADQNSSDVLHRLVSILSEDYELNRAALLEALDKEYPIPVALFDLIIGKMSDFETSDELIEADGARVEMGIIWGGFFWELMPNHIRNSFTGLMLEDLAYREHSVLSRLGERNNEASIALLSRLLSEPYTTVPFGVSTCGRVADALSMSDSPDVVEPLISYLSSLERIDGPEGPCLSIPYRTFKEASKAVARHRPQQMTDILVRMFEHADTYDESDCGEEGFHEARCYFGTTVAQALVSIGTEYVVNLLIDHIEWKPDYCDEYPVAKAISDDPEFMKLCIGKLLTNDTHVRKGLLVLSQSNDVSSELISKYAKPICKAMDNTNEPLQMFYLLIEIGAHKSNIGIESSGLRRMKDILKDIEEKLQLDVPQFYTYLWMMENVLPVLNAHDSDTVKSYAIKLISGLDGWKSSEVGRVLEEIGLFNDGVRQAYIENLYQEVLSASDLERYVDRLKYDEHADTIRSALEKRRKEIVEALLDDEISTFSLRRNARLQDMLTDASVKKLLLDVISNEKDTKRFFKALSVLTSVPPLAGSSSIQTALVSYAKSEATPKNVLSAFSNHLALLKGQLAEYFASDEFISRVCTLIEFAEGREIFSVINLIARFEVLYKKTKILSSIAVKAELSENPKGIIEHLSRVREFETMPIIQAVIRNLQHHLGERGNTR